MGEGAMKTILRGLLLGMSILACCSACLVAQEAVAKRNLIVRRDPSKSSPIIDHVVKDDRLNLIQTTADNGYYHVTTEHDVSADGYRDAGFFPVKVSPKVLADLSVMLVPQNPTFQFDPWDVLVSNHPRIAQFLSLTNSVPDAARNYATGVEDHPTETACLLNLATAMSQIFLANGTPLDYFRSIEWATLAPDRFFGYAIPGLVTEIKAAASKGLFAPEIDPSFFHGDATSSFKEVRFGEANVQLTFHENDKQTIGSDSCIRVEPDIDYYKDLAAHALLEVLSNKITNSLTDPTQVYVLRWIAGKQAGLPEFDPPYKLVE